MENVLFHAMTDSVMMNIVLSVLNAILTVDPAVISTQMSVLHVIPENSYITEDVLPHVTQIAIQLELFVTNAQINAQDVIVVESAIFVLMDTIS